MSSKELVVSSNRHETKVAVLEDDQLVEIYFQRANEYSLAGSIHKGRVTRVLPGMQSAFVDIGLERDTFLYVSDFFDENGEEYEKIPSAADEKAIHRISAPRIEAVEALPTTSFSKVVALPVEVQPEPRGRQASSPEPGADAIVPGGESRDKGDRRNRRSRRKRTRSGGFPDSKYASDTATPSESIASTGSEPANFDEEPRLEEVFLLPGESLAKYSARPETPVEKPDHSEPVQEAEEALDEAVASRDVVPTATEDLPVSEEAETEPVETVLDAEEPVEAELAVEPGEMPAPGENLDKDFPDLSDPPAVIPIRAEFVAESELEDAGEPVLPFVPEERASDDLLAAAVLADLDLPAIPALDSDELAEIEQIADEEAPAITGEATGDPKADETLTASVRDPGTRFPHRGSRRMRRRRGGDRGGERTGTSAAAAGESLPSSSEIVGPQSTPEAKPARERTERPERADRAEASDRPERGEKTPLPSITDLLREGQEIIVQIAKEPLGQKGARITSHIALPGRYVVYMPTLEHLGVSRKIASDEERHRLKRILQGQRSGFSGGFIVRTAGEGHSEEDISSDMAYLYNLWLDIRSKAEKKPAPILLHHDLDIVQRILRDQLSDMFKTIWVDSEDLYESILRFMQRFQPSLVSRVKLYTRPIPIFDSFNVTQEVEKALRPKVWLKSGGYIVVNQTEALVAIDVNTGKYVGKSNRLEDTITKTNTEAVREIVRQIRLRDLGGIIVVDFIDMDERKNRQKVMQALEEAMAADRAPYKILQFNDFGLVAITRKRVKQSLERTLCAPCPTCEGAAYVKSVVTVIGEILQEAQKLRSVVDGKNVVLRTHPDVAKSLKSNENTYLEEVEEILGRPVLVTSDPLLHPEKFDLAW